jgi:hypothetical protein
VNRPVNNEEKAKLCGGWLFTEWKFTRAITRLIRVGYEVETSNFFGYSRNVHEFQG